MIGACVNDTQVSLNIKEQKGNLLMKKSIKKLSLVTTAALLFLLTATAGASPSLPLPSIAIETEDDADDIMPVPEEPGIQPMADDEDATDGKNKSYY